MLIHPDILDIDSLDKAAPANLTEWNANKSRKLDIAVSILLYHLGGDNRPPLHLSEDGSLIPDTSQASYAIPERDSLGGPVGSDKIIVFTAFPGNLTLLEAVSGLCS